MATLTHQLTGGTSDWTCKNCDAHSYSSNKGQADHAMGSSCISSSITDAEVKGKKRNGKTKNYMSEKQSAKVTAEIKAYWTAHLYSRKSELLTAMGGTEEQWQIMEAGLDRLEWVRFPIQHPNPSIEEMSEIAAEAFEEAPKEPEKVPVLYQGHKGPGVGVLKTDAPHRRDGDKDTVVAERRPRKSEKHPKSPIKLSDYGELKDAIQDYKQTISVPKGKKPSAEKQMGYRSAIKQKVATLRRGRGGIAR